MVVELPNSRPEDPVSSAEREEDAALARRAGSGEAEAFGVLYDRYVDAVYRYVFYRVRNEAEAEDVTSDVFMRALRAIPKYEPRQAFLAWLYRIARNAVIDRSRRQGARQQVSFEDALAHPNADQVVNPDAGLLAGSDASVVRVAMQQLTPLQQEILVLRYVEGYDTKTISKLVGKRDGTIRGIEFRALSALRALIPSREAL
ncbi:MAG TPA: RNA polymerase sigma factor [Candidatus Saccharimonadales bacterium]|jgi:RNA polymerase sigma-70 factor, ECF subfamily|nr:RNA polymerase sigma factor [Candidatus Saccharimonadales bacterium]